MKTVRHGKRNPVAKAIAENLAQFRVRTVRDRTVYTRKQKHRKGE